MQVLYFINILKTIFIVGIKTLKISLFIFILTLLLSLIISGPRRTFFTLWGIYDGYNLILEYKLSNALNKLNITKTNKREMDLQKIVKKQIKRVCFQHPYMLQEAFEKQIDHKTEVFSGISDGHGYVLWLFYSDGSIDRARPRLIRFLNDSMSICRESTLISLRTYEHSSKFYKFNFVEEN